jgi:hypothetical protein
MQNVAYSATLQATGGTTPYTWSIIGSLPAGLSLNAGTGAITGTPTGVGTSSFTAQVTDANNTTAQRALSITVNPAIGGGIALVQANSIQGTAVGSVSVAFPVGNTAGNLILAYVRMSSTDQTVSVTDTAGNTYTEAVGQVTSAGYQGHLFYAANIAAGANTVTATFSSTNNHPWLAIYEYSGLSPANPLDQTAAAEGSSTAPTCGPTAATTSANELVFAGLSLATDATVIVTPGAGFNMELQDTIANGSRAATEDQLLTATGSVSGAFTVSYSTNWTCVVATFK